MMDLVQWEIKEKEKAYGLDFSSYDILKGLFLFAKRKRRRASKSYEQIMEKIKKSSKYKWLGWKMVLKELLWTMEMY